MPNRKKTIIRIISIGLIAALFAGMVLNSKSNVVQAKDVFLGVQSIRNDNLDTSANTFTILEIVDKVSSYKIEDADGNFLINSNGEVVDGFSIDFGEEEIGYLIGGEEPFSAIYEELLNGSRGYSNVALNTPLQDTQRQQLSAIQAIYGKLLEAIQAKDATMLGDTGYLSLAGDTASKMVSYEPNPQEYENYLRFVDDSTVTSGYMVPDDNGPYVAVYDAADPSVLLRFTYAGDASTPSLLFELDESEEESEEEKEDQETEEEESEEDSEEGTDEEIDSETKEEDTEGEGKDDQEGVDGGDKENTPETPGQTPDDPTQTPGGEEQQPGSSTQQPGDATQQPEGSTPAPETPNPNPENPTPSEPTTTPEPTPPVPSEPTTTPEPTPPVPSEPATTPPADTPAPVVPEVPSAPAQETPVVPTAEGTDTTSEVSASLGALDFLRYGREVVYGKQQVMMAEMPDAPQRYRFEPLDSYNASTNPAPAGAYLVATNADTTDDISDVKIDAIYQFSFLGIENKEWFKNHIFGLELNPTDGAISTDSMKIEVISTTPGDAELAGKIAQADLVYWNADLSAGGSDISVDNALVLLNRVTALEDLPCIINNNAFITLNQLNTDSNGNLIITTSQNYNVNKLLYLLYQEDVKKAYEDTSHLFNAATNWATDITATPWKDIGDLLMDATSPSYLNAGHFVRDNIYVINYGINSVTNGLNVKVAGSDDDIKKYFDEVFYRIEQEQYERQQKGVLTWDDATITPALAMQTILTYSGIPPVIEKSHIRVLELQPCYSFDYAGKDVSLFKEDFLPEGKDSKVNVEIIGMTTAEFCGKLEDINVEYDMIYLGSNTDLMNRMNVAVADYCTVYNDFNMYGIVYSHIGDLFHIKDHGGLIKNEGDTYRYSGNDILAEQKEDLLSFLDSGAPIVLEDNFFVRDASNTITSISTGPLKDAAGEVIFIGNPERGIAAADKLIVRNGILDSSTYIYQFLKEACANSDIVYGATGWSWENRTKQNLLTMGEVEKDSDKKEFVKYLNQPKMSIHMLSQPTEYNYTTKQIGSVSVIADSSYLQREENGYYLTYEFSISNLASVSVQNTTYSVALYVDANMDGKFSAVGENLSGDLLSVVDTATGQPVGNNGLKAGVHYRVRRPLPYDAVGAIPWKLVVSHNGNSDIRSAVTGITAVRTPEKQTIKVLQLYDTKNNGANIETHMQDPNSKWRILLENVPDFDVTVKSIDATQYFGGTLEEELNNYDMLIVGFADAYQLSTGFNAERLKAVIEYANSGKCVLFTHDNTNWYNGTEQDSRLNMHIRDLTGLDRYGVTVFRTTDQTAYGNNKIKDGENITISSVGGSTKESRQNFFNSMGMGAYTRDIAFAINTDQKVMDSRTQGLTYSANEHDRYLFRGPDETPSPKIVDKNGTTYKDIYRYLNLNGVSQGTWINQGSYQVEKINSGAITEYPYRLSDTIAIGNTHAQYYQLDLESDKDGDGEGDVVVWYTINNSVANNPDIYDYSPNDVRNNYYIYNRGNITYTGMGHSNIDREEEIKLFINTMVAAYRVSIQSPEITIVEGLHDDTKKNFDAIPAQEMLLNNENTYKIYFTVNDMNLVSEEIRDIYTKIFVGEGTENINVDGEVYSVTDKTQDTDWQLFDSDGNVVAANTEGYYNLTAGRTYILQIPLTENGGAVKNISELRSIDVYLEAKTVIRKRNKVTESAFAYDNFKLTQINLFDLD